MDADSWWADAHRHPRHWFWHRLWEQAERIRQLTTRKDLEPRGREGKSLVKGGRQSSAWGEGE